jgi:cysteinyl-tRNA synthetase
LGGHYRSQLQFSRESLDGAKNSRKSLLDKIQALAQKAGPEAVIIAAQTAAGSTSAGTTTAASIESSSDPVKYLSAFDKALEEDLNTPRALAELWGLLRDPEITPETALAAAFNMDSILALGLQAAAEAAFTQNSGDAGLIQEIEGLIAERAAAKKAKDFTKADGIRAALKDRGIILEDGAAGTTWRRT